ncbi:AAA family ATPase [Streptosporangium sp. NPDC002721]|uniref:AAA family ATPase n=1 Tax=Streptosporangium sp. NPDC002721 TaxID=3366188 RepID=UPI0036D0D9CB
MAVIQTMRADEESEAPPPTLTGIEVSGLLGQFNHIVKFNADSEFVILHGPNGVGKTKFLELIAATFSPKVGKLRSIPFSSARFAFSDGTLLVVSKGEGEQLALIDVPEESPIVFRLSLPGTEDIVWNAGMYGDLDPRYIRMLERENDLIRIGPNIWRDARTGEIVDIQELSYKNLRLTPRALREMRDAASTMPGPIKKFLESLEIHLIETQRLLNAHPRPRRRDESDPQQATVLEFSQDLIRRIKEAQAQNSRISQQLDRKFPRRLLHNRIRPIEATEENIRQRYNEQGELRKRLAAVSLLDTSDELPLPEGKMDDWQCLVLWNYLDDTQKKLATFSPLLDRVELFTEIVNSRFLHKKIVIDRDRGLTFITTQTGTTIVPDQLSSGEQHELVLVYDLLFNTKENSLVLIDEPEISLHVSWQQAFLSDIIRIANLTSLRFIIATHSPQIIHTWWSRAVALAPQD